MSLPESVLDFIRQNSRADLSSVSLSYSSKFSPYNAIVRCRGNVLSYGLSREWEMVDDDIVLGLLQSLAVRLLKLKRAASINMDLYINFIKSINISAPRTVTDPVLEQIFEAVNQKYFEGLIAKPNFAWHNSVRRLASYNYHTDTISVSDVFIGHDDVIGYLLYHEVLDKKLKFSSSMLRATHHSRRFRDLEEAYESSDLLEKKIKIILANYRRLSHV